MARRTQDLRRIEAREAELLARLKADQAELEELRVARRVLSRLAGSDEDEGTADGDETATGENRTIGDLAFALLYHAKARGLEGLTSNEILELLRAEKLPDLMRTSLSPPLSRLKKRGKIEQVGDLWRVVPGTDPVFE